MKIESYSLGFKGLYPESVSAAAFDNERILTAAAGAGEAPVIPLIKSIEELSGKGQNLKETDLKTVFTKYHKEYQAKNTLVSAAGIRINDTDAQMFSIGNARCYTFTEGYMTAHTDDHSKAYEDYLKLNEENAAAYDRVRHQKEHLVLRKALGLGSTSEPQFYTSFPLQKDEAFLVCTESFWSYLSVVEMELDYRKSAGPKDWLKVMCRRILMKANKELDDKCFAVAAAIVTE